VILRIVLPHALLLEREVVKVTAEAPEGSFTMLERHIDFVAVLTPGLLSFVPAPVSGEASQERGPGEQGAAGGEVFLAVNGGTLVKRGRRVNVSTREAVQGDELGTLRDAVDLRFLQVDERERKTRSALSRMEASFARRFLEMGEHGGW
jgi:F-type H+-transporting ATPase subunit epsilon